MPSDGMARRLVDPSLPMVRPYCLHTLLMLHMLQQMVLRTSSFQESYTHNQRRMRVLRAIRGEWIGWFRDGFKQ